MAVEVLNVIGEDLAGTARVMAASVLAVADLGLSVALGPLDDELLATFGVMARGEAADLEALEDALEENLGKAGVRYVVVPYGPAGERG